MKEREGGRKVKRVSKIMQLSVTHCRADTGRRRDEICKILRRGLTQATILYDYLATLQVAEACD